MGDSEDPPGGMPRVATTSGPVSDHSAKKSSMFAGYAYLIALALVVAATSMLTLRPIADSDFWHHIAFGRIVVEEGRFPAGDQLSYTASGRPWISSGWLPAVLLYKVYAASPEQGPVGGLVRGVVFLTVLLLFFYGFRRTRNSAITCLLILLAMAVAYPRFLPRPDLFSQALIVPLMILLVWYEESPLNLSLKNGLRAALLPLLFVVWANCHMLFVIGFAIASVYVFWSVIQWKRKRRTDGLLTLVMWFAAGLGCLATPYGIHAFWFIAENARLHDTASRINELKPSWLLLSEPGGLAPVVLFALWAGAGGWLFWRQCGRGQGWWRVAVMVFLLGLALLQRRQLSLAAFGITPLILAAAQGTAMPRFFARPYGVIAPVVVFVLLLGGRLGGYLPPLPAGQGRLGVDCEWFPCEAVKFLKANPPPPGLFHDLYTGGFLAYHLAPRTRVFIDGRLEVYNNGTYDDFFGPPEGRMALKDLFVKYGVHSALLDWRGAAQPGHTAMALASQPDWRLCWFSDHYALFVHEDDSTTSYTQAHGYRYLDPLLPQGYMNALANPATAAAARAEAERAISENPESQLARKAMEVSGGA